MDSEIVLMWQQSQGGHPKIVPVEIGPVDLSHWSVGEGGYPVLGVQWLRPRLRERLCHTLRANRPNLVGNRLPRDGKTAQFGKSSNHRATLGLRLVSHRRDR